MATVQLRLLNEMDLMQEELWKMCWRFSFTQLYIKMPSSPRLSETKGNEVDIAVLFVCEDDEMSDITSINC